jgi:hypothetical protein
MTFLNFSQLSGKYFPSKIKKKKNTFLETKLNFSLTRKYFLLFRKYFSLINFFKGKKTQKNLENGFSKITFRETNEFLAQFYMCNYAQHLSDCNFLFIYIISHRKKKKPSQFYTIQKFVGMTMLSICTCRYTMP